MKAAFYTLGCKVNQYESQAMEELFRRREALVARLRRRGVPKWFRK